MVGLFSLRHSAQGRDAAFVEHLYFTGIYSFIGSVAFLVFGLLHIMRGTWPVVGFLELVFALGFAANALFMKLTGRIDLAKTVMLIITFTFLMLMLVTGGIANTGLQWFFVFPVVAFFMTGTRQGAIWMALLFAFTLTVWLMPDSTIAIPYDDIVMRQFMACLFVVSLGIFFYQLKRDMAAQREHIIDRSKSEFLTLTSHQLRTPISAIGWLSEILLSGDAGKLGSEQKGHIQHIYDSNQRLASIVDAMLIVSGLELKQLEVRPEPVDLSALSRKILAEQIALHPDKELSVSEVYAKNLPKLRLDPSLMKIILQNVFSNAIKYTPTNGSVSVTIERSNEQANPSSKGSIVIDISDTGYGIAEDQQEAVFTKLFRAENIKQKDTDGTGLGLYIVKEVLDAVGGKIWFMSVEGKGSTFSILLPVEGMRRNKEKSRSKMRHA